MKNILNQLNNTVNNNVNQINKNINILEKRINIQKNNFPKIKIDSNFLTIYSKKFNDGNNKLLKYLNHKFNQELPNNQKNALKFDIYCNNYYDDD